MQPASGSGIAVAMQQDHPIVGFRQDRIGARIICLLNVMRLSRKFDVTGKYLWLSDATGPYADLLDPGDVLADSTIAAHVQVVGRAPDLTGRQNIGVVARRVSQRQFAQMLDQGHRFVCDAMAEPVVFMDESAADVAAEMRGVAADLALAAPLRTALQDCVQMLGHWGNGQIAAIHVRRGDILDAHPWSYSGWSSKYVPDEFFRAFLAETGGPVLAFSDTLAAIPHLAQGDPRVLAVADLLQGLRLPVAARDLLELLLMARCDLVGAPHQSAFSRAAALIGGCRIVGLPSGLSPDQREAAYDALLDRVVARPDSFLAPGDLAQSLAYLGRHAVLRGRGNELLAVYASQKAFLNRFPFLHGELAAVALDSGDLPQARRLAQRGLDAEMLQKRDRALPRQVLLLARGDDEQATVAAEFLELLFSGRAAEGVLMPRLAHRLVMEEGPAGRALMAAPILAGALAQVDAATGQPSLPLWVLRCDWAELIGNPRLHGDLLLSPDLHRKLGMIAPGLAQLEAAISAGGCPDIPEDSAPVRLGLAGAVLRAHGRLNRAFSLLHWLDAHCPDQPLTHKRLADACYSAGNRRAGGRWLRSALALAPDNPLLHLSAALRLAEEGALGDGMRHLETASNLWPDLPLIAQTRRQLRRSLPPPEKVSE